MRKLLLIASGLLISTSALANDQQDFAFGISESPYVVGPFKLKSCQILIPDLGASQATVESTLKKKGFLPVVNDKIFVGQMKTANLLGTGTKTLSTFAHRNAELRGIAYLDSSIDVGAAASQTKLMMKVVGEEGMESLYESEGYDFHPVPGHTDLFDANDLPECKITETAPIE